MKWIFAIASVLFLVVPGMAKAMESSYGVQFTEKTPITIAEAVSKYPKYKDKDILVSGKVVKVCEKSGCWMSLQDGKTQVRTLFKDYGFFVPKEIKGKIIQAQGRLVEKEISAATARHYLKDEGASMKEINKLRKPQKTFEFVATGVQVI